MLKGILIHLLYIKIVKYKEHKVCLRTLNAVTDRTPGNTPEIWTGNLQNTNLQHYRYLNLFWNSSENMGNCKVLY